MTATQEEIAETTIVLGTMRSPGTCTISGHDRNENWDVQKAKGTTGASSQLNGKDIGKFTVTFYLVDDGSAEPGQSQFEQWDRFEKLIRSLTDASTPVALPIYHPDLARQGFTEVSNAGIGGVTRDKLGGRTVTVSFIEYKPPKKKPAAQAQAKPAAAGGATGAQKAPDPNAKAKQELKDLVAAAKLV
jgi:hypothetical protein